MSRDICVNRHGHNPQSEAANRRVQPMKSTMRTKILAYLQAVEEATCEDIVRALDMKLQSVSARVSELKAEKMIEETGYKRFGYALLRPTIQQRIFQ